jgi:hypothetical protein
MAVPQVNEIETPLCENLCEKNFPKSAKIGKNQQKLTNM